MIPRLSAAARQACFASTSAKATQPGSLVRSRHRAALKGVEEARRMHKPEGWTSSLQKFLDAPYEGADSVATAALQQPEVDNSPQGSPSIAVPRKKGVKDGPWTARDDQAMVEALTENANRSKGGACSHLKSILAGPWAKAGFSKSSFMTARQSISKSAINLIS